ncbi:MAG: hypothetical protein SU899_05465 [Chloroflexota bacterium]|nr:hypothetical protein [Chloroflexota bacterium]
MTNKTLIPIFNIDMPLKAKMTYTKNEKESMSMTQHIIPKERIENLRGKMKERVGWTDEELDILSPKDWAFVDRIHKLRHYKMVAEVVQINGHCDLLPKVGDKYVFDAGGILIPEETTFPRICSWALAGIFPLTFMVMDRTLAGLDPNEMWRDRASCMDLGIGDGGLGQVIFRVYCEKT